MFITHDEATQLVDEFETAVWDQSNHGDYNSQTIEEITEIVDKLRKKLIFFLTINPDPDMIKQNRQAVTEGNCITTEEYIKTDLSH